MSESIDGLAPEQRSSKAKVPARPVSRKRIQPDIGQRVDGQSLTKSDVIHSGDAIWDSRLQDFGPPIEVGVRWLFRHESPMPDPKLEEVFKTSGVPTYTFVKPVEYDRLIVGLRTPGRGLIIEGPSGIGKTTSVLKALEELGLAGKTLSLSARKAEDRALIAELPSMTAIGTVLIDDFHRLDDGVKHCVADYLKTLADEETPNSKLSCGRHKQGGRFARAFCS